MLSKPRLRQVRPNSPFRPVFDSLNRAVMEQADVRPGTGFGMTGRSITRTSQDWMVAYTVDKGADAASISDGGRKWVLGKGVALECTLDIDDDDNVSIVLARPADADDIDAASTRFTYYNPGTSETPGNSLVFMEKRFGLWMYVKSAAGVSIARAKATEAIPGGTFATPSDSGEAQIYRKDSGGAWAASGDPVTIWNDHRVTSIPVGTTIKIALIDGDWYLIAADCPT